MAKTAEERVREILFSELYPLYLAKVERKGRAARYERDDP